MKRFYLLVMSFALVCVTAFAQNGLNLRPWQGSIESPSTTIKGIARQTQPATGTPRHAPTELVEPPATASVETWYTADGIFYLYGRYGWEDYTSSMQTINVAIDGDNLYIQGLSYYFPGWIKGTINGSSVVFDNAQLVGGEGDGLDYLVGGDNQGQRTETIVFNYYAQEGILQSATAILAESPVPESIDQVYAYWVFPTFTKEQPHGPEPVVAPEGLVTDEWAISATDNFGNPVSGYVNIGFDGNNVYMQGLCTYLPETWIKGTLDGASITFPGDQYFGPYDDGPYAHYEFFLRPEGVVFTYDAEAGKMTAQGEIYIREAVRNYKGDVYNDPIITKVFEKAATPATPNISQIYDATSGPVAMFTVPTTDVDGNAMVSSKVSFQFLKDVEQVVSPVTFSASDYQGLQEDMTIFPYGFNDGMGGSGELNTTYFYLKQADYSTWNKIGLQVIYTGGGVENKSEIFWLTLKEYEKATFNFNAMTSEPCSTNVTNDGDINEDRTFTAGQVTLTVTPKAEDATTPNRFWNTANGPQLRVYSGTMTFEVPQGKVITKMVFNNGKWNAGNSADTGTFEDNVWTGYAQKVVVTIAGNTQLNNIEVYPTDFVPTAVEAPEGLVTDTYIFHANSLKPYYDPAELTLWVKAGFDGDDAYIQGLVSDVNSNADQLWVKATKNAEGKYVIPANQFMGSVSFWMSTNDYFFTALDDDGNMIDAVLDFDAEKQQFTTSQTLIINGLLADVYAYQTFTDVTITKFDEVAATPANPTITQVDFGEWSHSISCSIPDTGTNGETLNPQKLFYTIWVEKDGVQAPYTFTSEMYYGFDVDATEVPYATNYNTWDGSHSIYFYDDASILDTWDKVGIQSIYYGAGECKKSDIDWVELRGTGIRSIEDGRLTTGGEVYNLAGQRLNAPRKGLNIINGKKVMTK